MTVGGSASATSCSISPTRITHPSRVAWPISKPASRSRIAACRLRWSVVTILGHHRDDHYRIELCGMLYHQYAESKLKGTLLKFNAYISRIIRRVTLFIGLRGSLAADRTARMLHALLVSLAVWMAAGWLATIPFAPKSFPGIFNTVVLVACYATGLVLLPARPSGAPVWPTSQATQSSLIYKNS